MKKVLALFDGEHFSNGVFEFVCRINETQPLLLTGVFLPSIDYTDVMLYYMGGMAGPLYVPAVDTDIDVMNRNIEKFESLCQKNGIEYRVHKEIVGSVIEGIKKETRYADMLVLGSETFYSNLGKLSQEDYLKDTMHYTECPIVVVPEHYDFPQSVILTYDGSQSSVFAIKQFSYLFPEWAKLSTLLVYASGKENGFPDISYIEEFAARHFEDLTIFKLDADPRKYFGAWVINKGSALLVSGSYGRSALSEVFKKSFAAEIISDHKLPVFIAHT